ncbi:hypothetical protein PRZ48_010916 [Zasmidium cellare]|uniref:Polyprotein n=1 Tax=Zasmidium cellare TaxID=395010 RepID=A0ABR0EA05_ZASCE|nr:hypothetical protein PRZ48_010916 [Zasmidium cellare]
MPAPQRLRVATALGSHPAYPSKLFEHHKRENWMPQKAPSSWIAEWEHRHSGPNHDAFDALEAEEILAKLPGQLLPALPCVHQVMMVQTAQQNLPLPQMQVEVLQEFDLAFSDSQVVKAPVGARYRFHARDMTTRTFSIRDDAGRTADISFAQIGKTVEVANGWPFQARGAYTAKVNGEVSLEATDRGTCYGVDPTFQRISVEITNRANSDTAKSDNNLRGWLPLETVDIGIARKSTEPFLRTFKNKLELPTSQIPTGTVVSDDALYPLVKSVLDIVAENAHKIGCISHQCRVTIQTENNRAQIARTFLNGLTSQAREVLEDPNCTPEFLDGDIPRTDGVRGGGIYVRFYRIPQDTALLYLGSTNNFKVRDANHFGVMNSPVGRKSTHGRAFQASDGDHVFAVICQYHTTPVQTELFWLEQLAFLLFGSYMQRVIVDEAQTPIDTTLLDADLSVTMDNVEKDMQSQSMTAADEADVEAEVEAATAVAAEAEVDSDEDQPESSSSKRKRGASEAAKPWTDQLSESERKVKNRLNWSAMKEAATKLTKLAGQAFSATGFIPVMSRATFQNSPIGPVAGLNCQTPVAAGVFQGITPVYTRQVMPDGTMEFRTRPYKARAATKDNKTVIRLGSFPWVAHLTIAKGESTETFHTSCNISIGEHNFPDILDLKDRHVQLVYILHQDDTGRPKRSPMSYAGLPTVSNYPDYLDAESLEIRAEYKTDDGQQKHFYVRWQPSYETLVNRKDPGCITGFTTASAIVRALRRESLVKPRRFDHQFPIPRIFDFRFDYLQWEIVIEELTTPLNIVKAPAPRTLNEIAQELSTLGFDNVNPSPQKFEAHAAGNGVFRDGDGPELHGKPGALPKGFVKTKKPTSCDRCQMVQYYNGRGAPPDDYDKDAYKMTKLETPSGLDIICSQITGTGQCQRCLDFGMPCSFTHPYRWAGDPKMLRALWFAPPLKTIVTTGHPLRTHDVLVSDLTEEAISRIQNQENENQKRLQTEGWTKPSSRIDAHHLDRYKIAALTGFTPLNELEEPPHPNDLTWLEDEVLQVEPHEYIVRVLLPLERLYQNGDEAESDNAWSEARDLFKQLGALWLRTRAEHLIHLADWLDQRMSGNGSLWANFDAQPYQKPTLSAAESCVAAQARWMIEDVPESTSLGKQVGSSCDLARFMNEIQVPKFMMTGHGLSADAFTPSVKRQALMSGELADLVKFEGPEGKERIVRI